MDSSGRILDSRRAATAGVDGEALFEELIGIVDPLLALGPVVGIGVGCGGPMTGVACWYLR